MPEANTQTFGSTTVFPRDASPLNELQTLELAVKVICFTSTKMLISARYQTLQRFARKVVFVDNGYLYKSGRKDKNLRFKIMRGISER